jgi:fermentation-respiration switch protein FrsA (DUF1100 family)
MRIGILLVGIAAIVHSGCVVTRDAQVVPLERMMVYQAAGPQPEDWRPPGLQYEDAHFESADGTRLYGWYCPVANPRARVLYCHGNGGNITYLWPELRMLTERLNVSVMAFDYRGYGRSEGTPSERGLLADARAARSWFAEREQIPEEQIVLYGRSLGGAVAVDLASHDGARGLVLESTFTSLPAVANDLLPLWPGMLMYSRYSSIKKIGDYRGPLLHAHGDADPLVPFAQGERLFAAANDPKRFVRIEGEGHNWAAPEYYVQTLDEFFASLPAEAPSAPYPRRETARALSPLANGP